MEGPKNVKNGRGGLGPKNLQMCKCQKENVRKAPKLWKEWARGPWAQELANVVKRVCDISMGVWRGPDCGKWAKKALGPRISKFHKEKMCYFNKDLEGPRVMENGQGASCPRVSKCYKENV